MDEIPIFPLNAVLFPGTDLHLHIFEDRYKVMITECIENESSFGIVLIKKGFEAFDLQVEPFHIGCTAAIRKVEKLQNGNLNIIVRGQERFRLLSISKDMNSYFVGKIKLFPFNMTNKSDRDNTIEDLTFLVQSYLDKFSKERNLEISNFEVPDTPFELATFSASILHTSPLRKQHLLSMDGVDELLEKLVAIYSRELFYLDLLLTEKKSSSIGAFSIN